MDETQGRTDSDDNANTSFQRDEDDLARQRTCHIVETVTTPCVVTVHMNSGKPSLFSFIHTRTRGHVAIGDVATKWMIINKEQWTITTDNVEVSDGTPPLSFFYTTHRGYVTVSDMTATYDNDSPPQQTMTAHKGRQPY